MNEAKLSYTIKAIDPQGFDEMFTVRNDDSTDYFSKIAALKKWLVANGYSASRSGANGNATGAADDAPVCQYHGPMRLSKFGGFHCPKKLHDGTYCQSKSDVPHQGASQGAQPAAGPMPQAQAVTHAANGTQPPLFDEGPPDPADNYYTES